MNVLDEQVPETQRLMLQSWGVRVRQIGLDVGRQGMKDEEIIPLLHRLDGPTFFSRDHGFYQRRLCHATFCLVLLDVGQHEVASFVRRFLRHPAFNSESKRMGTVVRVEHARLWVWRLHATSEEALAWPR